MFSDTMTTLVTIFYILICLFLIGVVLLQQGRGSVGSTFGGGGQTAFGAAGAGNFLTKLTTGCAILFIALSGYLSWKSSSKTRGHAEQMKQIEAENIKKVAKAEAAAEAKKKAEQAAAADPAINEPTLSAPAEESPVPVEPTGH